MNPITIMQFFHWYTPADGNLWKHLKQQLPYLSSLGIDAVWLPPACKGAAGKYSRGYDSYDLFDLGEFDQKGTLRTKYGTKRQYVSAVKAARRYNIFVVADAVFNHKSGGDALEKIMVKKVNPLNRNEFISEPFEIEAWTKFTFPGRAGKYSKFMWDYRCFTGVDYANDRKETAIYAILNEYGEEWDNMVDKEYGNYDFLMSCDIEFRNEAVREELKYWGKWYMKTTGVGGFRLDAVKHFSPRFVKEWVRYMKAITGDSLFFVGEYWDIHSTITLETYISRTEGLIHLFDVPLHHNFYVASRADHKFDIRNIFNNTLMKEFPLLAVTFVDNHDSQPLQTLESPVEEWFKPLAYAIILLREQGIPCVFYPALYGAVYKDKGDDGKEYEIHLNKVEGLERLLQLRKEAASGTQHDYIDHYNVIGWTREGTADHPRQGCAVLISNGADGYKTMYIGKQHAGNKFIDALGKCKQTVTVNDNGEAEFFCLGRSVSVWVQEALA